ncbi:DUF807 family protein [Coxiella endosymbiont of Ornithodoros amblus]|nr:DUF807 family protein [Coxiella endosymbiont of Ornithodoros amblus]
MDPEIEKTVIGKYTITFLNTQNIQGIQPTVIYKGKQGILDG